MRILGIDPGTSRIGYGLIETDGMKLLDYGVIEAKEKTIQEKISTLSKKMAQLLADSKPDFAGIEKLYFAKNQKTALDVAQARGVIMSLILQENIPISEHSPNEVKAQVTGYGLADKKGVAKMVKAILKISDLEGYDDASDALAIAITAADNYRLTK